MDDEQDDVEIDTELFIQYLLACSGDENLKKRTVDAICEKTGLIPEKVEVALKATLEVLLNINPRMN